MAIIATLRRRHGGHLFTLLELEQEGLIASGWAIG
jgi:hypothetical protein